MKRSLVRLLLQQTLFVLQIGAVVTCPADWVALGNSCYKFNDSLLFTQPAAKSRCVMDGGYLAITDTLEEVALLRAFLDSQYGVSDKQFWIGLERTSKDTPFTWGNGCILGLEADWGGNEPNDDLCMRVRHWSGGNWNWGDNRCTNSYGFICEKKDNRVSDMRSFKAPAPAGRALFPGKLRIEQEVTVAGKMQCLAACGEEDSCESFAYNSASRQCRLLSHRCDGSQHQDDARWKTFSIREL